MWILNFIRNLLEIKSILIYFPRRLYYKKDTVRQQYAGIKKRKLFLTDSRMGLFGSDRGQGSGETNIIQNVSRTTNECTYFFAAYYFIVLLLRVSIHMCHIIRELFRACWVTYESNEMVNNTALYVVMCLLCGGLVCTNLSGYVSKCVRRVLSTLPSIHM
jgi:hypothetical protein